MTNAKVIKLYSKNENSLKRYLRLLKEIDDKWKNLTIVFNRNLKTRKKKITVLKSPHVNKKAQTQFQTVTYSTIIKYLSWERKKNYIILKKIKDRLFPDVRIKIEQATSPKKNRSLLNSEFVPKKTYYYKNSENLCRKQIQKICLLDLKTENRKIILKKTLKFLKILDIYGNISRKSSGSSVG